MSDELYLPGGKYWESVHRITQKCSCSTSLAADLLKLYDNDEDAATLSMEDSYLIPSPVSFAADTRPVVVEDTSSSHETKTASHETVIESPSERIDSSEPSGVLLDQEQKLILPTLSTSGADIFSPQEGAHQGFLLDRLAYALQNGLKLGGLLTYFSFYQRGNISKVVNGHILGVPSPFYAVATNDASIVRCWIEHGGNPNEIEPVMSLPLLAFSILYADTLQEDTTAVVMTLIGLGANPLVFPKAFYTPCLRDLPSEGPDIEELCDVTDDNKRWCTQIIRQKLANLLNLTQRYFLAKKARAKDPSLRFKQAAEQHLITPLFNLPFFLVGQEVAVALLNESLLTHLLIPTGKPLILFFAGPSGHGKTELGNRLGNLISLDMEVIDMTEMDHERDLWGPKAPWVGSGEGSPLNNFLARTTGRRAIVLLDEFEKTSEEVRRSLLVPFRDGKFTDRRNRRTVDCSKIIWILTSNALDPIIVDFVRYNTIPSPYNPSEAKPIISRLQAKLEDGLKETFGSPIAGRITGVIPFLPFSHEEQAAIVHKYILELAKDVRIPPALPHNMVGSIILRAPRDATVCSKLAEGYDVDTGAPSLQLTVADRVRKALLLRYLDENELVREDQQHEEYLIELDQNEEIVIFKVMDLTD